jgi:hypothetical protein
MTVYFYAVNSGAFAVMTPLLEAKPLGMDCFWVTDGQVANIPKIDEVGRLEFDEFRNLIENGSNNNKVLILGSQHNFKRTVEVIKLCKLNNIKSVFIFDHWSPFVAHFTSQNGSLEIPTHILAIDEILKSNLISKGINENQISTNGHPGIEQKIDLIQKIGIVRKNELKRNIGIGPEKKIVLLTLELLSKKFNANVEFGMITSVMQALKDVHVDDIRLAVRIHPHQPRAQLIEFLKSHKLEDKISVCPEKIKDFESIAIADIVIGMNTSLLVIPLLIDIPTITLGFDFINDPSLLKKIQYPVLQITIPHLLKTQVKSIVELNSEITKKLSFGSQSSNTFPTGSVAKNWSSIIKVMMYNSGCNE